MHVSAHGIGRCNSSSVTSAYSESYQYSLA